MNKEVVVTGLGVVTPLGNTPNEMFEKLITGTSGVAMIERFDTEKFPVKFAGEIKEFDASPYFDDKEVKRTSRYIQYIMHAAISAAQMAGLDQEGSVDKSRAGVIVGSGMGGIECFTTNAIAMENKSPSRVSPFFIPQSITNMGCGMIAIKLGWQGPNWSVTSACATGNHSIMSAADEIRMGRADVMICGGSEESVCEASLAGFANMKALSRRNEEPTKASRPFDAGRDGFVMGEGAGSLVLESREHAEARGAKILAVVKGYGASCDAHHMSAPLETGEGVALAVNKAIADGGIAKEDVQLVNCHATSTPLGDVAEVKAVRKVFGDHIKNMYLQGSKSMLGHSLGAASAVEAVISVLSLQAGKLHPTINVENQDERCDVDCIANVAKEVDIQFALSNSFGFGGHNSSVLFQKA
jgi:3-oxoacyl-[acyl-carrier-protein] synthase II